MNEAPKKIWVIRDRYVVDPEKVCEHTVPYIRADIVDELVEALKGLIESTTHICEGAYGPGMDGSFDKARAALAKLEEE